MTTNTTMTISRGKSRCVTCEHYMSGHKLCYLKVETGKPLLQCGADPDREPSWCPARDREDAKS